MTQSLIHPPKSMLEVWESVDSFLLKNGEYEEQQSAISVINSITLGTKITF